MSRGKGSRSQLALAFESTYGTAPASGYTKMPFAKCDLGAMQGLIDNELVGYGRDPLAPTPDAINVDGDLVVPIDARFIGYWLKAIFGAPSTSGTDPYTHVFTTGASALPSLALEPGAPEVPSYAMNTGVVVDELSISLARAGNVTASLKLIGQAEALATSAQSGTLTTHALTRFANQHGYVKRAGTALSNVTGAELRYANGAERIEVIRADGLVDGVDPGQASMSGRLVALFDSTTLLQQAIDGDPCALEFGWSRDSMSLTVEVHEAYLSRAKRPIDGPKGIEQTIEWTAALNAAEGVMATITLVNDVASY